MTNPHSLVSNSDSCRFENADDLAESYCLGQLSADEAFAFELHCCTCIRCTAALENAAQFEEALRAASPSILTILPVHAASRQRKNYIN